MERITGAIQTRKGGTMYINPFYAGIAATILAELALVIIMMVLASRK